jgi:hypothetical protein
MAAMTQTTAWLALLVTAGLAVSAVAMATPPVGQLAHYGILLGWLAYSLVGLVVTLRRPDHPIGWIFMILGLAAQAGVVGQALAVIPPVETAGLQVVTFGLMANLWVVAFALVGRLLAVFPDGRLPSRRWAPLTVLSAVVVVAGLLTSGNAAERIPLTILVGEPTAAAFLNELGQSISGIGLQAIFVMGALAMAVRFARSRGIERQQLKWFAYAAFVLVVASVGTSIAFFTPWLRAIDPGAPVPPAMFGGIPFVVGLVAIPVATGIAVLRYRLYEIDLLINRTLVYGALTATLVAVYIGLVIVLQGVLSGFAGGGSLAVAASTLAVAALFQPLRRRLQGIVDRRFYRSRYDAARTLERFSTRLRSEVDLARLTDGLREIVEETLQPASVSVWLRGR